MSEFSKFQEALEKQARFMFDNSTVLFNTKVSTQDLWNLYLESFPEGTNPIYIERTAHDCNCCKNFIRTCGRMVAIIDGEMVSIWDLVCEIDYYQEVADAMSQYVKSMEIESLFMHTEPSVGKEETVQNTETGTIIWDHFYLRLPEYAYNTRGKAGSLIGKLNTNRKVLKRSMEEMSTDAVEVVQDLIAQNSLYRGEEHLTTVNLIKGLMREYKDTQDVDQWSWLKAVELKDMCSLRNTVIGTLISDLSKDVPLEDAVRMFESKVAPSNYKRPKALVTKKMIDAAQKQVVDLGIEDSLYRRHAKLEDITINNVLFADRTAKKVMNVFDELSNDVKVDSKKFNKVEEISVKDFIEKVLPRTDTMEVLLENKHQGNLMTLIAPENRDAKGIFKWNNNFSWTYNGEVADSIKERVKKAGGNVTGDVRCSLSWFNGDDLDIHVYEPDGNKIYFSDKRSRRTGGWLDVDMNAGGASNKVDPVENITWQDKGRMIEGKYRVNINNFSKRSSTNVGFEVELEVDGDITKVAHEVGLRDQQTVTAFEFTYSKRNGIKITKSLPTTDSSKEIWGVNTQKFQKVDVVMSSPNHWDGEETGNKHWFFILEDCKNPDEVRGFYNEFLDESLNEHRKVFEVLASKLKVGYNEHQMSGVGFSSTQRNDLTCKVTSGTLSRVVKIKF